MTVSPDDLTPREGKVLRYVCSYTPKSHHRTHAQNVEPDMCVIKDNPTWSSNLPNNTWEAKQTLERLRSLKLVKRAGEGYEPTKAGRAVVLSANGKGLWQAVYD